jgi:peptidoglycan/LPS O-acetylase OafA/YrhL
MRNSHYQPHIDGLRAVAVLSVLVYHINNSWLPGGFVGVDIFFVISGYLITKIIYREIKQDKFTLVNFYQKRIKRILPVYFFVSIVSCIFALTFFFPEDLNEFSESVLASTFFVSNYYFWRSTDYFSSAIELKPLVHTWSLAVEEQFYTFWPLLILSFHKYFSKKKLIIIICVLMCASLGSSYILSESEPIFAYYSIITRLFELMIGALISFIILLPINVRKVLSYIGVCFILYSLFFIQKSTPFPSLIALLPSLGAACIILSTGVKTLPIRLLETKGAVFVGLISYSLYMWHWPVLAFSKYYYTELSLLVVLVLLLTIFTLSVLTRNYVEKKVIELEMSLKKTLIIILCFPSLVLTVFSLTVISKDGMVDRWSANELEILKQIEGSDYNCSKIKVDINFIDKCILTGGDSRKNILLWGDSHANHFFGFFDELSKDKNINVYIKSFPGCPPIYGVYRISQHYSKTCFDHNIMVFNELVASDEFDIIVLAANWVNYPLGPHLSDNQDMHPSIENSKRAFYFNLSEQLTKLSTLNKRVWFINSVPNFKINAGQCSVKNKILGYPDITRCIRSHDEISLRKSDLRKFVNEHVEKFDNITLFDFENKFCNYGVCSPLINNEIYYKDGNHLSDFGSRKLYFEELSVNIYLKELNNE